MKKQTKIILGIGAALAAVGLLVYNNKSKKNFANASGNGFRNAIGAKVVLGETKNLTEQTGDCADCSITITVSGEILSSGENEIIERGVCWATNYPSIANNKVIDNSGQDNFSCEIPNLSPNVMYYLRSYAKDSKQVVAYGTKISYKKTIGVPVVSTLPTNFKLDKSTTLENEFDNSAEYKYSHYNKSYSLTTGVRVKSAGSCSLSGVGVIYSLTPLPSLVDLEGDNPPKVKYLTDFTPLPDPPPVIITAKPSVSGCFYCLELKNTQQTAQTVSYTDCSGVKNSKSLAAGSSIMVKEGTLTKGNLTVLRSGTSYTVCDGVPVPINPVNVDTSYSCADAKKMLEEHKATMARSRYTEQGMVDAQQKLAELQFAVTKACQTETAPITTATTNTNTATVSLPPKLPVENCFDCQTWKNGAMFINPIYDVSYVDCNGKSFSKQSVLPNQEIQVKAGTLYYPKSVSDMSFNGESNFRNLLREPISKINTHDLMLKSSNKVCEKISSLASFNGGFANSVGNNYFSNNFLNADGGGQPDGTGDYSTELILPLNTTVYIRGFATNQYGTSYGSQVVFKVNAKKIK